jgi:hypothetical protein
VQQRSVESDLEKTTGTTTTYQTSNGGTEVDVGLSWMFGG